MNKNQELLQKLEGKELEQYGCEIFQKIGLKCFTSLGQTKICDIASGYADNEHLEFDYLIPHQKVCLIGEITSRSKPSKIRHKYDKFSKQVNIIKNAQFSEDLWLKLGIESKDIRNFQEIESIKAFFILTDQDKNNELNLAAIEDIVTLYKADLLRLIDYSETIGRWTKKYFLSKFNISSNNDSGLTVYENSNRLIINKNKKISSKDNLLSDLYTFTISPYELLDIAHVYRKDELSTLEDSVYNYQRLLDGDKLRKIRKNVLNNPDFMFPSDILVILSTDCTYTKDGSGNHYLYIPKKYGVLSVIDGQHRLFSYADEDIESKMKDDCHIKVTAIYPQTSDKKIIGKFSASVFIEINTNQTRIEISHLDQIAYELGSEDPKVIATKIIVNINERKKFQSYFSTNSNKNSGIVESGTIIAAIKKITNPTKIRQLEKPRTNKTKIKKIGHENLFESTILELSDKDLLVEKGVILLERYFSEIFSVFRYDKLQNKITDSKEIQCSFYYSKFWAGFVNLLIIFLEEGLDWEQVRTELRNIQDNVMKLRQIEEYKDILFYSRAPEIPDASSSPTKTCTFLNKNRKVPTSIQSIK